MFSPGKVIKQKYRIIEVLNKSRMAGTYLAADGSGKKLVIKVLELRGISDWKILQLFEREALILKRLSCKGIPKYIDYFTEELEDNKIYYIVYEFVEGRSLLELLEEGFSFDYKTTASVMEQVLEILQYLHSRSQPVIHRDINPKNIIMTEERKIFLVDFGAGKKLIDDAGERDKTTFIGTYGYVPMEQMTGDAVAASDIYALGMTAVHLIAGKNPANLPMKELRPQYLKGGEPKRLDRIIEMMIEPDVNKRKIAAADLYNLIKDNSIPVVPESPGTISVHYNNRKIKISEKEGKEVLVAYNKAGGGEGQIQKLLLDIWITKPWIILVVLSMLSAGSLIIPYLILYLHPRARGWVNKIYSKYNNVRVTAERKSLRVRNQLNNLPYKQITDIHFNTEGKDQNIQLEVILELKGRKERYFYFSGLNSEDVDIITRFLVKAVK